MTPQMSLLMNASLIPAVDSLLTSRMGYLWYIALFCVPVIMVYVKTQSVSFTAFTLLATMMFYGVFLVSDVISMQTIFAVIIAIGVMAIFWKAFSPSN
jgi:hypothetical protein